VSAKPKFILEAPTRTCGVRLNRQCGAWSFLMRALIGHVKGINGLICMRDTNGDEDGSTSGEVDRPFRNRQSSQITIRSVRPRFNSVLFKREIPSLKDNTTLMTLSWMNQIVASNEKPRAHYYLLSNAIRMRLLTLYVIAGVQLC
jgi:hypothetical protein